MPSSAARARGLPLFWRVQIAGWIAFSILSMPVKAPFLGWRVAVEVALFREPLGFVLTLGLRWLYLRLRLSADRPLAMTLGLVPASLAASGLDVLLLSLVPVPVPGGGGVGTIAAFWFRGFIYRSTRVLAGLDRDPRGVAPVVQGLADYLRYSLLNRHASFVPLESSVDPRHPEGPTRVQRGGSFLCHESYCSGYRWRRAWPAAPTPGSSTLGSAAWRARAPDGAVRRRVPDASH